MTPPGSEPALSSPPASCVTKVTRPAIAAISVATAVINPVPLCRNAVKRDIRPSVAAMRASLYRREMTVDVRTEIEIERPLDEVAAYAADPDNATDWYESIESVEWKTEPPLAVGSRVSFVARFLGRRVAYTYEIRELVVGEHLRMSTADGPFAMETTYTWAESDGGGTKMTLRNRGEPSGFATVAAPLMAAAMRRANRKDLARLKEILEDQARRPSTAPNTT